MSQKNYYVFREDDAVMFVRNVAPEAFDAASMKALRDELKDRGWDSIIYANLAAIVLGAQRGDVVLIGGPKPVAPVPVVKHQPESFADIDVTTLPFEIALDEQAMAATLRVVRPSEPINARLISAALAHSKITFGLIAENLARAARDWPGVDNLALAKGLTPVQGADAEITDMIELKDDLSPEVAEDGRADFKELKLISMVSVGNLLQTRKPPTAGTPGCSVLRGVIAAVPGQDRLLRAGQNTAVLGDGLSVVAMAAGFVHRGSAGELNVRPVYVVGADVDYSTGNIRYKGDVLVKGDVRGGFGVDAEGDIRILGAVEDAVLEARGNIDVAGGVVSSGSAHLKAGKDIRVGFIQKGRLEAGGSVYVRGAAAGASITAGRNLEVNGRDGKLASGEVAVGGWVVVSELGHHSNPPLQIKFPTSTVRPATADEPYGSNFLSARIVRSPARVFFGSIVTEVSARWPSVTVCLQNGGITIDPKYISAEVLMTLSLRRTMR